jgi:hypothetical protein
MSASFFQGQQNMVMIASPKKLQAHFAYRLSRRIS